MNNNFLMILHNLFQYFNYLFFFHIDIKTIIIKMIMGKKFRGAEPSVPRLLRPCIDGCIAPAKFVQKSHHIKIFTSWR